MSFLHNLVSNLWNMSMTKDLKLPQLLSVVFLLSPAEAFYVKTYISVTLIKIKHFMSRVIRSFSSCCFCLKFGNVVKHVRLFSCSFHLLMLHLMWTQVLLHIKWVTMSSFLPQNILSVNKWTQTLAFVKNVSGFIFCPNF